MILREKKKYLIALCGSEKKYKQSFDKFKEFITRYKSLPTGNTEQLNPSSHDEGEQAEKVETSKGSHFCTFDVVRLVYNTRSRSFCLSRELPLWEVDVLFHKISGIMHSEAKEALLQWCSDVNHHRAAQKLPMLIVLDPIQNVESIHLRSSTIIKIHDLGNKHPFIRSPLSFLWENKIEEAGAATPNSNDSNSMRDGDCPFLTHSSFPVQITGDRYNGKRTLSCCESREYWWIIKPDKSSGAVYSHEVVIWRSKSPQPQVPLTVFRKLTSSSHFVLQEFFSCALPVVLKVYCIGKEVFVKAAPTFNLLSAIDVAYSGEKFAWEVPVVLDTQNKHFFSSTGWSEVAEPPSDASQSHTMNSGNSGTSPIWPSVDYDQWERWWNQYLFPGSAIYSKISEIAQILGGSMGFDLSLFGFDLVLVPSYFLGTKTNTEAALLLDHLPQNASAHNTDDDLPFTSIARRYLNPHTLFDLHTGEPSSTILEAVPFIVDVNYFPGYKEINRFQEEVAKLLFRKLLDAA